MKNANEENIFQKRNTKKPEQSGPFNVLPFCSIIIWNFPHHLEKSVGSLKHKFCWVDISTFSALNSNL